MKHRLVSQSWNPLDPKPGSAVIRELMQFALKNAEEVEVSPIGKGIHRPYKVVFQTGIDSGCVTTKKAAFKTIYCQLESKRYCKSVDLKITGPERELLSYELDKILGFDLVPTTVMREIARVGGGSVQAWVDQPTAWQWKDKGYDFKTDVKNPWLHRLAAFDFIRGEIDRHSNNWLMDESRRVYAIDNGYSFVKGDDRTHLKSSAGKALVGYAIHPEVLDEIHQIKEDAVARTLAGHGFLNGEEEGVLTRVQHLKRLDVWTKLGDLWS